MQLTMTGEYAIRAMIHLAGLPMGTSVQIAEIARAWNIPESFLRKIITQLTKTRMVSSTRGIGGGVRLTQDPASLTVISVIEAVDGPMTLNKCLIERSFCDRTSWCAVHDIWYEAQEKMKQALGSASLAELARVSSERQITVQSAKHSALVSIKIPPKK
jgi:Rrf2 family iron-sulfur cluster assembly transcriptional regulator